MSDRLSSAQEFTKDLLAFIESDEVNVLPHERALFAAIVRTWRGRAEDAKAAAPHHVCSTLGVKVCGYDDCEYAE